MISFAGDLGNDLLPEEMKIAHLTVDVVSATLVVIKEVIRSITSLLNQESSADTATFVPSIERLLKLSQEACKLTNLELLFTSIRNFCTRGCYREDIVQQPTT
ncbi:hypothetical protein BC332_00681 [Capsicum chinense]|nr:hypothetical protein BC332_00681 [Capsicum chinense]